MAITILTANLLTTAISNYLVTFRSDATPLVFTLIAMAAIVLILYPLFTLLEDWAKTVSLKIVRKGKSLAGKYLGLLLAFISCLAVLCYYYTKMWYHIDLFKILLRGEIGAYL